MIVQPWFNYETLREFICVLFSKFNRSTIFSCIVITKTDGVLYPIFSTLFCVTRFSFTKKIQCFFFTPEHSFNILFVPNSLYFSWQSRIVGHNVVYHCYDSEWNQNLCFCVFLFDYIDTDRILVSISDILLLTRCDGYCFHSRFPLYNCLHYLESHPKMRYLKSSV